MIQNIFNIEQLLKERQKSPQQTYSVKVFGKAQEAEKIQEQEKPLL